MRKVPTSGGDTSVGEVETYLVGVWSKMAHKESEANKAEKIKGYCCKTTRGIKGANWSSSE